jgi:alanine-synthesizing transaminase
VPSPEATMFAWAPIPKAFAHLGSLEFSKLLLKHAGVAVAPGIGFGEYGDNHVRIALVENKHRIRQAAKNIKTFLRSADSILDADPKLRAVS